MLEIYVNARKTIALKTAILDAIENGQYDTMADDIRDCFTDDQLEQIEGKLDTNDIDETIDNILSDWSGDSADELFDALKDTFSEADIELNFDDKVDLESDGLDEEGTALFDEDPVVAADIEEDEEYEDDEEEEEEEEEDNYYEEDEDDRY